MTKAEAIDELNYIKESFAKCELSYEALDMAIKALEVEPKTGKWVTVHGYCTPGGDPVWACSECGKGRHVYGIEHGSYGRDVADGQWKACPNCGAKMEGE